MVSMTSRVTVISAVLILWSAAAMPSLAADNRFEFAAGVEGTYAGNVFFSETEDVSSSGATTWVNLGLTSRTPRSTLDLSYRPTYRYYEDSDASDANNLSHGLTFNLNQRWSPRVRFLLSEYATYTPEHEGFNNRPDDRFTVTQRAERSTFRTRLGWTVDAGPRTRLRFGYSNYLTRYDRPELETEDPLYDRTTHRGTVGISFATDPRGYFGVVYDYTRLDFDREDFFRVLDKDGALKEIKYQRPGLTPCSTTVTSSCYRGFETVEEKTDAHNLGLEYRWEISEQSRGRIGAGAFRSEDRERSDRNADGTIDEKLSETSWYLRASVTRQLSRRISSFFGASRDVSSFGGLSGLAVGETAFARFQFDTTQSSNLQATLNYMRREDLEDGDRKVRTAVGNLRWRQRLGRWGGWNAAYSRIDQSRDRVGSDDRDNQYDLVFLGIFFERPR
jgi:hypothetical protein